MRVGRFVWLVLAVTLGVSGLAGRARVDAQGPVRLDPALLSTLRWRSIGPANTGGRVADFAVARVSGAPDAIYVGTASGGIFKSINQGTSWTPMFDRVDAMMSIGDLAVAPSNLNVVWAGTGEANNRQSSSWGDGVYKSVDAGRTWTSMGLKETRHIGRIVVHPTRPDIVYVAAVGHLWGSNAERGVFKTTDGGQTWQQVLFVDDHTGATDLIIDPQDPDTLLAATYQRQRKAWGFNGGGPGSGIYRTTDGGATWTRLTAGLPRGDQGRIGLDVFQRDGRFVYAVVEAAPPEGGIYRSTDRGDTWQQVNTINPRPMYYSQIRIDPKDRDRVYLLGSNRGFYVSEDGGQVFRDIFSAVHSEDHALWIDPDDTNHLIVGGDGGVSISWDRGETWLFRDNLPIGQFYEIAADMKDPYTICGGLQDNGMWCTPSATRHRNGISNADAYNIGSGDGFHARIDPRDPNTIYIDSQEGRSSRVNLATLERQAIAPVPTEKPKRGTAERWNWNTPLVMSSFDPAVIYTGSSLVFRSPDRGVTWKAISPDLTATIDRDQLQMMGAPVGERALSRHDGQTAYGTLTAIGESPLDARVLCTGSDDGQIQVTRDAGATWMNVTGKIPGLPPNTYVSSVLPSRHAAGRIYATFDGHFNDDYRPYVYVSDDYGRTWRSISAGLPETGVNRLREHPRNPRLLVLGHERGLHVSIDGGASWVSLRANMPTVPVDDLMFHPRDNDLIVGTHGRSLWVMDDITSLEKLTPEALMTDQVLVPPARARLLSVYNPQAWFGAGQFFAPNPEFGAVITYYLREATPGGAEIGISDRQGKPVRVLKGPARRGLNRVVWDLRMQSPVAGGGEAVSGGSAAAFGAPIAPRVLPATYKVTLTIAGASRPSLADLRVEGDPRAVVSDADRRGRYVAQLTLYELQTTLGDARAAVAAVANQTAAIKREVGTVPDSVNRVIDHLSQLQRDLNTQLNGVSGLARAIDGYSGLPTTDQKRQIDWAFDDTTRAVNDVNGVLQSQMPALYADLARQGTSPKRIPPIPPLVRRPTR